MNTKTITKFVAFVVTFALSVTIAGFFKPSPTEQSRKITALLTEDISNGTERRSRVYTFDELVSNTEEYVSASENIDYSDLPADFTDAWLAHMRAWRTHSDSLKNFQSENTLDIHYLSDGSMEIKGDFYLSDTYRRQIKDFSEIERREVRQINQTWYRVLQLARKYGAEIPANALN